MSDEKIGKIVLYIKDMAIALTVEETVCLKNSLADILGDLIVTYPSSFPKIYQPHSYTVSKDTNVTFTITAL